jgi:hypothetical protein
MHSLFARLISHQSAVLFSQNKPATSNQPQPASSTLLSEQTSTSHQPTKQAHKSPDQIRAGHANKARLGATKNIIT